MKRYYYIACIIIFILTAPITGKEDNAVIWMHPDQPPYSISNSYGAGLGIIDCTENLLKKHLPDFTHIYQNANSERILAMIKEKENVCSAPLIRTPEREKFIEFSIPYRVVLSNCLIILESQKKKFSQSINIEGVISLEEIIKQGYRIGITKGRAYRGIIDEILNKYKGKPNIIIHSASQNAVGGLIKMMAAGRIDCLIAYPFEAKYVENSTGGEIKITSIPIAGMNAYGFSMIGCSKTKKGKEIISRLNPIILKYKSTPELMGCTERWLDTMALKRFREYTAKEFGK